MSKEEKNKKEAELVKKLQNQEVEAIETLYENYSSALYGIIYQIVRQRDIAEDVLQESFVKIWKKIGSFDSKKGRLFTWMLNVARNTAIDKLRSKNFKKSRKVQSLDNSVYDFRSKMFDTSREVNHIGLQKLIDQLKPEYKTIIDILYFQGYTQKEASEELDIPLGTVKTRARTAIIKLRELLKT